VNGFGESTMIDFNRLRQSMVDSQIRPNDVTDLRIIGAMLDVPRERFVPPNRAGLAYLDDDLPVNDPAAGGTPRFLIEPMILAKLIQALDLSERERVLDVGCATGYSAALLRQLAAEVIALESDQELADAARRTLGELGMADVQVVNNPLTKGAAEAGPYDAILVNGSVEFVPDELLAQLKEGGRLVAVVRRGPLGRATLYLRASGAVSSRPLFDAAVPALPGFEVPRGFVF
jgi:protein-L-isoaspartate(D-aspartate) O-methyltransferase